MKKKRLRRAHWRQQQNKLKKNKNIEKSIECLLEGGGRARSNGERNEQKKKHYVTNLAVCHFVATGPKHVATGTR